MAEILRQMSGFVMKQATLNCWRNKMAAQQAALPSICVMDNGLPWPDFQETPSLLRKRRLKRK